MLSCFFALVTSSSDTEYRAKFDNISATTTSTLHQQTGFALCAELACVACLHWHSRALYYSNLLLVTALQNEPALGTRNELGPELPSIHERR